MISISTIFKLISFLLILHYSTGNGKEDGKTTTCFGNSVIQLKYFKNEMRTIFANLLFLTLMVDDPMSTEYNTFDRNVKTTKNTMGIISEVTIDNKKKYATFIDESCEVLNIFVNRFRNCRNLKIEYRYVMEEILQIFFGNMKVQLKINQRTAYSQLLVIEGKLHELVIRFHECENKRSLVSESDSNEDMVYYSKGLDPHENIQETDERHSDVTLSKNNYDKTLSENSSDENLLFIVVGDTEMLVPQKELRVPKKTHNVRIEELPNDYPLGAGEIIHQ